MKKYIFTLIVMLASCQITFAQDVKSIFNEFKDESKAECISISPFMMSLGKMFMGNEEGTDIAKKVKSMRILDLEDCPAKVKERFAQRINKLDTKGYETLIKVNDDGKKVRIMTKSHKEIINEMLIICIEDNDCTLIQMNCKIKKKDIAQLVDEQTNKKNHGRR